MHPVATACLVLSVFVLGVGPAEAALDREIVVAGGPEYGVAPLGVRRIGGLGGGLELGFGIDDELTLSGGAHWISHASDEGSRPFEVGYGAAGLRYAIDVMEVTPFVRADLASYFARPTGADAQAFSDWSVQGAVGLDWRAWDEQGLAVEVRFHDLLARMGERPSYVTLWVSASWTLARVGGPPPDPGGSGT